METGIARLCRLTPIGTPLTDSVEEVLVVVAGEVEIVVGDERRRASAGTFAVVPAEVPHDVRGIGERPARVAGIFPSQHGRQRLR